ncbi:helix-turn-helix domain-containing protein [Streptomyces sp. NPDC050698]
MEIARAAAGLFVRHGLRATRAEDIAQAAGIAPRTFYRYFATKEEAVAPLYAAGAQRWVEAVRAAPAGTGVLRALEQGVHHTLTPGLGVSAASWEWVRTLLRLAEANPSLRRVWAEVCQTSERLLGEVLAHRVTRADATRGSRTPEARSSGDNVAGVGEETTGATGGEPSAVSPELRFAAAVASAAVRAALEAWAEGDGPVEGPEGPAGLALRNLAALRDFPWAP